jgi:hypothetical protein
VCCSTAPARLLLKMDSICYSKMLLTTYQIIRCHNPEDHNMNLHVRHYLNRHLQPLKLNRITYLPLIIRLKNVLPDTLRLVLMQNLIRISSCRESAHKHVFPFATSWRTNSIAHPVSCPTGTAGEGSEAWGWSFYFICTTVNVFYLSVIYLTTLLISQIIQCRTIWMLVSN